MFRLRHTLIAVLLPGFLISCGSGLPSGAGLRGDDSPQQIYVRVSSADGSKIRLVASSPDAYDSMWYCAGKSACEAGMGKALKRISGNGGRAFFEFPDALDAASGIILTLVAARSNESAAKTMTRTVRIAPRSGQERGPDLFDWQKQIELVNIPSVSRPCDVSRFKRFYCDVMQHTKNPYLGSGDPSTDVHETQHFMLHEHAKAGSKFIYWQDGKGAYFPEPRSLTRDVTDKIIYKSGMYYKTYIASRPTQVLGENIVDEWRAYLTEEIYGIEAANSQGMGAGGVEFLYYNAAALHALSEKEPEYLTNKQGVAVFAMLAEVAHEWTISRGVEKNFFSGPANQRAQSILALMRTDPAHAPMRDALKKIYGSAWTARVLGF